MFASSAMLGKCAFGTGRSRPPAVYWSRGPVPPQKSSRSELEIFATSNSQVSDRGAAVGKYTSGMGHFCDQQFTGRLGSVLLPKGPRWNAAFSRRPSWPDSQPERIRPFDVRIHEVTAGKHCGQIHVATGPLGKHAGSFYRFSCVLAVGTFSAPVLDVRRVLRCQRR